MPTYTENKHVMNLVHPGSPSWKKVAIPKWINAEIPPPYFSWCGVGNGGVMLLGKICMDAMLVTHTNSNLLKPIC